jgi:hypothetical protein
LLRLPQGAFFLTRTSLRLIRRETLQDRVNDVQPPRAVDACTHRGVLFGTDLFEIRKDYLASLETLSRGSRSFPAVPGTQVANQVTSQ